MLLFQNCPNTQLKFQLIIDCNTTPHTDTHTISWMNLSVSTSDVLQAGAAPRELTYNQIAQYQYCLNGLLEQQTERLQQIETCQSRLLEYQQLLLLLRDANIQVLFPSDYLQYSIAGQSQMTGVQRSLDLQLHVGDHTVSMQLNASPADGDDVKVYYKNQQNHFAVRSTSVLDAFEQWCNQILLKSEEGEDVRTVYEMKLLKWYETLQTDEYFIDTRQVIQREWSVIDQVLRALIQMLSASKTVTRFIQCCRSTLSPDTASLCDSESASATAVIHAPRNT